MKSFSYRVFTFALVMLSQHEEKFHLRAMAQGGLRAVREALIFANAEEIIDDEDFVPLYNAYASKPVFPYWKFNQFDPNWSDTEC